MSVKTKLAIGLAFLFIVILLIGAVGIFSINKLASDSQMILKSNYESLQYVKNMEQALNRIEDGESNKLQEFESNLSSQEKNVTEPGEREATNRLRIQFDQLKNTGITQLHIDSIRASMNSIQELNMNAIVRKNNEAVQTANKAKAYLTIIGAICFLVSFSFVINFPGYIANPIRELTAGIKQIAAKNYSQRLHFRSSDEFGELASAFNQMAEKLDDYENSNLAKIIFEKRRIETIINNMHDPIIGFNEKRIVLFANDQAVRILGMSEQDLIGKYAPDIAVKNDLMRTLINDEYSLKPLKIYADGKESYFTREVFPILSNETSIGSVIVLKNITQFRELDLAKTNFIATISHELKTPISSIKMSLKLLEDKRVGAVSNEQQALIGNIRDDLQRLLKITGELLDLAQVETGNIQLQKQLVSPKDILLYASNALKVQAEQKQIHLEIVNDPSLENVMCDLEKTAWVMVNFVSNAVRHSPEKSKIILEAKKENHSVMFSVQDFGKGIDAKYIDKIFDKFYQVPETDGGKAGTGLGLAISKDFITAQGGKIWVNSVLNEGSTFAFELPAA